MCLLQTTNSTRYRGPFQTRFFPRTIGIRLRTVINNTLQSPTIVF